MGALKKGTFGKLFGVCRRSCWGVCNFWYKYLSRFKMMIGGMEPRATEKIHLRWIPKQMIWKTLFNHGIFWAGNLCLMLNNPTTRSGKVQISGTYRLVMWRKEIGHRGFVIEDFARVTISLFHKFHRLLETRSFRTLAEC